MAELRRFITCGSVDDGKSTLIGRLLGDTNQILDDQFAALQADSLRHGTQGEHVDLALLLDGLQAEREQGITIDVAYRHFATENRRFLVADTPGHEQYTRNMVTGASNADAAVLLVDARKGVLVQTRRHANLVALMGVQSVIVAVNKMDLVDWSAEVFAKIQSEFLAIAAELGLTAAQCIPVSALNGDNIATVSTRCNWYVGPTLLQLLEAIPAVEKSDTGPFVMPVQMAVRPHLDFRGVSGTVSSGSVVPGQQVRVEPSGLRTTVDRIVTMNGDLQTAGVDEAVTLTFTEDLDIGRGDVVCGVDATIHVGNRFSAHLVWMHDEPLMPARTYLVKLATRTVQCTVSHPESVLDVNTNTAVAADTLKLNDIGKVVVTTAQPIPFQPYSTSRDLGGFIVVDRHTGATVAAGMVHQPEPLATELQWQSLVVDRNARHAIKGHPALLVWLTGLSGSGKSTIANLVEQYLHLHGVHTYLLDGDNLRHGLNRDLGFGAADRVENIRRAGEVAALMVDAGLVVLASFISPYAAERDMVRSLVPEGSFIEVHVDAPLEVVEARDPKGLYAKARSGQLPEFTGIDAPYEAPASPELRLDTSSITAEEAAKLVISLIADKAILPAVI
jgi:bifunctional enzyme CysN/CysC